MDEPILFNPDNRLLGGAAGDLSLYGGQSDPKFSVHQARDDVASSQETATSAAPDQSPIAVPDSEPAASVAPGDGEAAVVQGVNAPASAAFLITSPETSFEPIAPVTPAVSPAGAGAVLSDWNHAPQGAGSTNPALEPNGAADATHDAVTGTATALLDDLAGAAPGITAGALSPIADTAGAALNTVTSALDDTLEGLAGSDPLGGVATLVSLISVSDMFDLAPVGAPIVDAAGDPGLGVLDVLAGEELLPDPLLGTHHDEGLLGGGHLDHPLGL